MTLPNFLCVGTMKGGTTTLHEILKQHPDVLLPSARKELRFFDVDDNYSKGLPWYQEFFAEHTGQKATYAYREEAPMRIAKDLGSDLKLIFILRHPIDRAYSHYMMNCANQTETKDFRAAIAAESQRLNAPFLGRLQFGYLDQGHYTRQIRRFLEYFPRENMLFLLFEDDLIKNRTVTMQKVYSLLNVADASVNLDVWSFANKPVSLTRFPSLRRFRMVRELAKAKPLRFVKRMLERHVPNKLDPVLRRQLTEQYFAGELLELEQLIARDLNRWRS
jgi:hypothetical protein